MIHISIFDYILLALAMAIPTLVIVKGCALKNPIRLTRGLAVSFIIALVQVLLALIGMYLGNLLRLDIPEYDNIIFMGLAIVIAIRMFFTAFRKPEKNRVPYDISRWTTVMLLGVATGINTLLIGLSLGFIVSASAEVWRASIPLMVILFLLSYVGIMMGRQKKEMRERRWLVVSLVFFLGVAVKIAFYGE